ncbi:MAG: glycosyltransferase family 39 protein [Anaerolineae bacterium]
MQAKPPPWLRDRPRAAAYLLLLVGFGLRLQGLTFQSLWRDEVDSLRFAVAGSVTSLAQPGWNGPLYTFLLACWVRISGTSEFAGRFSSLMPGVLVLPLLFWLGRRLLSGRAGIIAMALNALSPYLIWYSQELKMYALLCFLGVASFAALLSALRSGGFWRWALYVCLTTVIPYVHILGVLLIPAQVVAFALNWPTYRRRWCSFVASIATLVLPYLPLAIWQVPLLVSSFRTGHPYFPLPKMLSTLAYAWAFGIVHARPWLLIPLGLASLAAALPIGRTRPSPFTPFPAREGGMPSRYCMKVQEEDEKWPGARRALLTWLLAPVILVYLISLRTPVFTDRYLIASVPPLYLLAAAGIDALSRHWRLLGAALLASVLMIGLYAVYLQSSYKIKTDARGAAAIIRQGWQGGDALVLQIPYLSHSMTYYLGPSYYMVEGPYTNYGMAPTELDLYFGSRLVERRRVWLVLSEVAMWDERGLTLDWFRRQSMLVQEWHLARLDLYLFRLPW